MSRSLTPTAASWASSTVDKHLPNGLAGTTT
jgi:hypothetical protein